MSDKPNPGYGYELCEFDSVSDSRQWLNTASGQWHNDIESSCVCDTCKSITYRRPIKPPADLCAHGEWVLLPEDEKMRGESPSHVADVVVWRDGMVQKVTAYDGDQPIKYNKNKSHISAVFRRVEPQVKRADWVRETMRMINDLTPDIKDKASDPGWFMLRQHLEQSAEHMKSPPVVKSDAEKAFDAHTSELGKLDHTSFLLGFNAAKKGAV